MQPTADSVDLIRQLAAHQVVCAAAQFQRSAACVATALEGFALADLARRASRKKNSGAWRAVRGLVPASVAGVVRDRSCAAPRVLGARVTWRCGVVALVAARTPGRLGCAPRPGGVGPPPNRPMQPTAVSESFIRETRMLDTILPRPADWQRSAACVASEVEGFYFR
jgi:hypothetical protein